MYNNTVSIVDIFKDTKIVVPDYQRSFAWTERQLTDLFNDLYETSISQPKHFMGMLIFRNRKEDHIKTTEVVDGQQRLTALTILISTICKTLMKHENYRNNGERIYEQLISDNQHRHLHIGREDNDFFWDSVVGRNYYEIEPVTPGQKRLKTAQHFFEKKLNEKGYQDPEKLMNFLNTTIERMRFVVYEVDHSFEVGLVFETINDRGKPLSQLDKIKNYLQYYAAKQPDRNNGQSLHEAVNSSWKIILQNISKVVREGDTESLENSLVRYHWIMRTGDYSEYNVHTAVKNTFKIGESPLSDLTNYIKQLQEISDLYVKITSRDSSVVTGHSSQQDEAGVYLELLNDEAMGTMANFAPVLMAVLKKSPKDYTEILRLCYLFAWRAYRICNRRTDAGIASLANYANQVYTGNNSSEEDLKQELISLIYKHGSDEDVIENLKRNTLSGPETRYLLYRWERKLAADNQLQYQLDWHTAKSAGYQIEHIWPQKPDFPRNENRIKEKRKFHEEIVNKIGNLVLLDQKWNASASNKLPFEKKSLYLTKGIHGTGSNLCSVRQLAQDSLYEELCEVNGFGDRKTWKLLNKADAFIEQRSQLLIDFVMEEWSLENTATEI